MTGVQTCALPIYDFCAKTIMGFADEFQLIRQEELPKLTRWGDACGRTHEFPFLFLQKRLERGVSLACSLAVKNTGFLLRNHLAGLGGVTRSGEERESYSGWSSPASVDNPVHDSPLD